MKTKTKKELKSLKYYLEKMTKKELEETYDDYLSIDEDMKKGTKKEIVEYLYEAIMNEYSLINIIFDQEEINEIKEDIKNENFDEEYVGNNLIFKTENGYEVPEELVKTLNEENIPEMNDKNKNMIFSIYVLINGLIEVDKLIDLMKQSGVKITKKEVKEYAKANNFILKDDVIYLNEMLEELNINNNLINIKNQSEYKIIKLKDMIFTMGMLDSSRFIEEINVFLKKKVKRLNDSEIKSLKEIIFNIISISIEFEKIVERCLKDFNIKLNKKDKEEFLDLLEEICYQIPSWTLNGYSPMEQDIDLDELLEGYDDECQCEFCSNHKDGFESLSKEEKINAYINVYLLINGIIEIDKLVEIINNYHNIKVSKKELIKIAKQIEEIHIIDNYLSVVDFDKEMFLSILALKGKKDYYIIKDIDEVYEEHIIMSNEIEELLIYYNLNDDAISDIFIGLNIGMLSEDYLAFMLEQNNIKMPLKKQKQLLDDMKPYIKNYRSWYLNGFKSSELNKLITKEKIGRNDLCSCGSGKKYKKCCGK